MPAANETPAPSAPAAKPSYFETMLEKAKKLPPGKAKEADREEREMRERAAADPEVAAYLDYLCRKFLGTGAGSVRLTASLKDWERQQQQQQQEEEERKKKEEEEEKARSERKRKAEEDTSQLDQSATSRKHGRKSAPPRKQAAFPAHTYLEQKTGSAVAAFGTASIRMSAEATWEE
ncbi:uncharacterized protein J4E84_001083 [Alternaria hordeiaustralica]|uniref:uncharacterized protein n=1 Tax=Alternaria hordeiaustralica TaxID=1187925 RepID=UPI0020C43B5D|nr:uncharacterized protein J4E84_001083 [Alternaria hordeiaustralica]KAI4697949.1 hypothetical protein J4E84_001083 [Alternaria hordeiaustralica]